MPAYLMNYDIPKASKLANPSPYLRRFAIRINESDWVMTTIPHEWVARMIRRGATVNYVEFASHEMDKIVALCTNGLKREVAATMAAAKRALDSALEELASIPDPKIRDKAERLAYKKARSKCKTLVAKYRRRISDMRRAAIGFGIDPDSTTITGAMSIVDSMNSTIAARCEIMDNLKERLTKDNGGDKPAIVKALEANACPPAIFFDYCEAENGIDVDAARKSFAGFEW